VPIRAERAHTARAAQCHDEGAPSMRVRHESDGGNVASGKGRGSPIRMGIKNIDPASNAVEMQRRELETLDMKRVPVS
jgi:hypothetical protein